MDKLITFIRNLFKPPSPEALALKELEESRRKLLEAQSAVEWSTSNVRYLETKIKRLSAYLSEANCSRSTTCSDKEP